MNLHLRNPLAIFDVEATGANVCRDRIVELFILKIHPDGRKEEHNYRINPGIPIPAEVSLIHGIYDADLKDCPTFNDLAPTLKRVLNDCDLAGFNHIKFDIPMLVEEFLRAGIDFDVRSKKLLDAQIIFHLMEKRTLSAAYKFYCGQELENAHNAQADTLATYEVLKAQLAKYDGREVIDSNGNKMGVVKTSVDSLHKLFNSKMVDLAGRFVYNQEGVEVMNFGKHRFRPVLDVLKEEPGFYDWMMRGEFPMDTKRKLTEIKLSALKR
jgi:DNA polymerase III subunit epsilon